jgi:hypothetical protein
MSVHRWTLLVALSAVTTVAMGCTRVGVMGPPVGDWADAGPDATPAGGDEADAAPEPDPEEEADGAVVDDVGPVDPADVDPSEEDAGPVCTYPPGPYETGVGGKLEPMSWPNAVAVGGEGGTADFESFHCDPEVRSIFVFVGNTW